MSDQKQEVGNDLNLNAEFQKKLNQIRYGIDEEPEIKTYIEQNLEELIELFTDAEKTKLMLENILKVLPVKSSPDTQRFTISFQLLGIIIDHVNGSFNQTRGFIALIDTILPVNFQTLFPTDLDIELKPLESLEKNENSDEIKLKYWQTTHFKIIQNAIANLIVFLHRPESSPYLQHFKSDKIEAWEGKGRKSTQAKKLLAEGFKITEKGIEHIKALTRTTIQEAIQNISLPAALNQQINELKAEKKSLTNKYSLLEDDYQALKSAYQQAQSEFAKANKKTDNTSQLNLQNGVEENASLKRKIDEILALNSNLISSNKKLKDENSELQKRLDKKPAPKKRRTSSSSTKTLEPLIQKLILFLCSKYNHTLEKKRYITLDKKHTELAQKITTTPRNNVITTASLQRLKYMEEKLFWFLSNASSSDNVNTSDYHNWSLLHIACLLGDSESVRQLLDMKAEIKNENNERCIPFTLAVQNSHLDVVKIFFEKKKLDKPTAKIRAALNEALESAINCNYFEMVELFLNNNLKPDWQQICYLIKAACIENKKEFLNKLLFTYSNDTQFLFGKAHKESIVELAPNQEILKSLLRYDFPLAPPHLPPFLQNIDFEINPYSFCAIVNDSQLLQELLSKKEGIEGINLEQALYLSLIRGYEEIFKVLLSFGYLGKFDCAKIINLIFTHTSEEKKPLLLTILFNSGYAQNLFPSAYYEIFQKIENFDHLKIMIDNNYFKYQIELEKLMQILFLKATEQNVTLVVNLAIEANKKYTGVKNTDKNILTFFDLNLVSGDAALLKPALESNKLYLIRAILNKNINVNALWYDYTALHYAVEKNDEILVKLLLEYKASVSIATTKGTALKLALDLNHTNLIQLLANPSYSFIDDLDKAIFSVLDFVFKHNDISLMQKMMKYLPVHLLEKNINDKLLSFLVSRDHSEIINCLLPLNINWNAISPNVLDLALSLDHIKIVRALKDKVKPTILKFLSDEEQSLFNEKVLTPDELKFFVAVLENNFLTVSTLIEKKVIKDVNFTNKKTGTTALMLAAAKGNAQMVRYFIEKAAKVDIKNLLGLNALDLAKLADRTDIIQLLENCSQVLEDSEKIDLLNSQFPSKDTIIPRSLSFFPANYPLRDDAEVKDVLFNDDLLLDLLNQGPQSQFS